ASMISPTSGSKLTGGTTNFAWSAASAATGYAIYVGTTGVGSYNIYASLARSEERRAGIPTNGSTVYTRLWTNFGGTWKTNDYTYTASRGGGGGTAASMVSPTAGSNLTGGTTNFAWSAASGATGYAIYVGTTGVGSYNIYASLA